MSHNPHIHINLLERVVWYTQEMLLSCFNQISATGGRHVTELTLCSIISMPFLTHLRFFLSFVDSEDSTPTEAAAVRRKSSRLGACRSSRG